MSESTLYVVRDGKVKSHKDYPNGHGYALPAWNFLGKKYCQRVGESDHDFELRCFFGEKYKEVWQLWKNPLVARWEKLALLASFDHAIAERAVFAELAAAFDMLDAAYRAVYPSYVCHYAEMAADLRALPPDVEAVCWQATSCGDDLWYVHDECTCEKCGDIHREEEGRRYDLKKDKGHWFIGETLAEQEKK